MCTAPVCVCVHFNHAQPHEVAIRPGGSNMAIFGDIMHMSYLILFLLMFWGKFQKFFAQQQQISPNAK
jgi:hypothetical protein